MFKHVIRALFFGAACIAPLPVEALASQSSSTNVLLIYTAPDHPHGTHMYEHECRLLARCLEQSQGVKTEVSLGWPSDRRLLENIDCIVLYSRPGGEIVLAEEVREQFMGLMQAGVGFVAIHWGTSPGDPQWADQYMELLGGCFHRSFSVPPLAVTQERLVQIDREHPICRGWTSYDLRDEWYLATRLDPRARPLLKVTVSPNAAQGRPEPIDLTVAWTLERSAPGRGRSFGTTLGHFHDNFGIEAFRRMLVNGILWAAGVEVPVHGAPVRVDDSDLILAPPAPKEGK